MPPSTPSTAAAQRSANAPGAAAIRAALSAVLSEDQLIALDYTLRRQLPWLVLLWAGGAALMTLRLSLGLQWVKARTLPGHYHADPQWQARLNVLAQRFGLRRKVRLGVSDDELDGPMTAGVLKPIVLLPASLLSGLPPDLIEALLAHELAHIKRHDYLVNLAQSAIEIVLFYHPVVWMLSKHIRIEREEIADDLAASTLGEPRRLALALSELDKFQFSTSHFAAPAAHGGDLMSRIKRLLRPDAEPLSWKLAAPLLGLCTACVVLYAHATPAPRRRRPSGRQLRRTPGRRQRLERPARCAGCRACCRSRRRRPGRRARSSPQLCRPQQLRRAAGSPGPARAAGASRTSRTTGRACAVCPGRRAGRPRRASAASPASGSCAAGTAACADAVRPGRRLGPPYPHRQRQPPPVLRRRP
ncbi:M56 family metallopeptidase [Pseudoduganella sp. UC29_106]|uniref:M56 family metallopeptidase n=1 Tax=Pseudoduganella sp. UC29_106 TaxID=3374553 RepID=UPI003757BC23